MTETKREMERGKRRRDGEKEGERDETRKIKIIKNQYLGDLMLS